MNDATGKDQVRQAFATRLRLALGELGISTKEQARLKRLFGVSGQAVRKWLDGTAMPTPARMPIVAEQLGVRRAWLQDGEDPMRPYAGVREEYSPPQDSLRLSTREARLLQQYRSLQPEQCRAIDLVIDAMAKTQPRTGDG